MEEQAKEVAVEAKKEFVKRAPRPAKRKGCQFCGDKNAVIDYKEVAKLRRFVAENGKILPRRQTGLCSKHQREVAAAVKRARVVALI